jgi:23S rRNA (uracil1939-C5)-methyltransferase
MQINIEKLIFEGYGLGHDESGRAVLVKKSVPGDLIDVEVTKSKKNFAEGVIKNVIKASKKRTKPRCPHFDHCGGCEHQNIAYEDQLFFKDQIFKEVLDRTSIKTDVLPIIPGSNQEFYYRNTIRFFISTDDEDRIVFQMHNFADHKKAVEIKSCLLQSEFCNKLMTAFKNFADQTIENKKDFWQLRIREGKQTGDFMVEFFTKNQVLPQKSELIAFLKEFKEINSAFHCIGDQRKVERRLLFGSPIIYEKIGRFTFQISPEAFFQTNSLGVKTLYDKIKDFAAIEIGDRVLDLYCGTGTIGIYLSTLAKEVTGIEIVQSAVNDAKANAKINHLTNCEFVCSDVEKWLENNRDFEFEKIIVDPPRQGLTKKSIEIISALLKGKRQLIYISCDPATFARDIKEFEKLGLKLKKAEPLDMFPQTHHIECIGLITEVPTKSIHDEAGTGCGKACNAI